MLFSTTLAQPDLTRSMARRARAVVLAPLGLLSGLLTLLMKPKALFALFLIICVLLAMRSYLRPPLSADISGYALPLLGHNSVDPVSFVQGNRPLVLVSPGTVVAAVAVVGMIGIFVWQWSMSIVAGAMFAVLLACQISVVFNYPAIIAQLDRESQLRSAIVSVLEGTAQPAVDISSFPRVKALHGFVEAGSVESAAYFLPHGQMTFLVLALITLLLVKPGPFSRRVVTASLWGVFGLLLTAGFVWPRLAAEWHWHRAATAEQQGHLEQAAEHLEQVRAYVPTLDDVQRTWMLRGKIDYQLERPTVAQQYYVARQFAQSGDLALACSKIQTIEDNLKAYEQSFLPLINRWMADLLTTQALIDFKQERPDAADQHWDRAMTYDPSVPYRSLCLAALRSRQETVNPQEVVDLIDPVIDQLADRSLRAALYAMVGDCFFTVGEFEKARENYKASFQAFSLPKTINYRALRGLLGW